MMYGNGWGWPMAGMMMIGWLLLALLVVAIVWIATNSGRRSTVANHDSARRILADRYARGELDTEEYHRRLDSLR